MARHGGIRMVKQWAGIPGIHLDFTSAVTLSGASLLVTESLTVFRMLAEYTISPSVAPSVAFDECVIVIGIGVCSTDAFAVAAAAALPDPNSEPEFPWLYWASHPFYFPNAEESQGIRSQSLRRVIDIRSMRKLKPRESLFWVAQYGDINGTLPMTVAIGNTRVLLAVH